MKPRKLLISLLVVFVALGLLMSIVACNPKGKNGGGDKTNGDETSYKIADLLEDGVLEIIDVADNTIKALFEIEDEAHVAATLFAKIYFGGTEDMDEFDLDLEVKVEATLDAKTKTKNAVLLEVKDASDGGLGVMASIFAASLDEGEYIYVGQQLWNSEFSWVKLSQADDAGLLAGFVTDKIFDLLVGVAEDKEEDIEGGLLNGLIGDFADMITLIAPLELIMPNTEKLTSAGFNVTSTTAAFPETKVAGGTELVVKVEGLSGIIGIAGGLGLNFADIRADMVSGGYIGIVNLLVDAILGQDFDHLFSLDGKKPIADPVYPNQIAIGLGHDGNVVNGIGLHYDYTNNEELPLKLDLGIKNLVISNKSVTTVKPSKTGYANAEEAAVEVGLDVVLASGDVDAEIKVYAYPIMKLFLTDVDKGEGNVVPYIDLKLDGIKGFATIKDKTVAGGGTAEYFVDFNSMRNEGEYEAVSAGFKVDLEPIVSALKLDAGDFDELKYFIPLDAEGKWRDYFVNDFTADKEEEEENGGAENAGLIDDIIDMFDNDDEGFDIGSILGIVDHLGTITDLFKELTDEETGPIALLFFKDKDRSLSLDVDLKALMEKLLADDGLIGESEYTLKTYYDEDGKALEGEDIIELSLAEYLAKDKVLAAICSLVHYSQEEFDEDGVRLDIPVEDVFTPEDAARVFKAVTGKELDIKDVYADLSLSAFVSFGASDATAKQGITLNISLSDAEDTLVSVELNINIKGEDTEALNAYIESDFSKSTEGFADTSEDDGKAIKQTLLDILWKFAQIDG